MTAENKKVVQIFGDPKIGDPIPTVVAELETMLALAKSGELRGFGVGYVRSDGKITTVIEAHNDLFALSHAIAAVWWRYQQRMAETSHTP